MDIRELHALGFSRLLSVTRLLNGPVPRDFKLFAIQTVSLAVTIWRRSASGKISGFFTKPSLFDRFTLFRTEMTKTETKGISSAEWILLSVIDYCFWRMFICQNLPYANRQLYFNLSVLFSLFPLPFLFYLYFCALSCLSFQQRGKFNLEGVVGEKRNWQWIISQQVSGHFCE